MRLDALHLTRFGHFTDRDLIFPRPEAGAPDLHLIYGPNEAGKSTLFTAWLDFLFGIPKRTKHDFVHDMKVLQIGAKLTLDHGSFDLKRVKRDQASLRDAHDQPLPETLLSAPLGNLNRDGYAAMFSLDDETLVKGGDGILASKGDLGEMLFSASAGLSELSPSLELIREELDQFHRKGKRSGGLWEGKRALQALQSRRKELEVSVSTLQRLSREAAEAEAQFQTARAQEATLSREIRTLTEGLASLPLKRHLAERLAALEPLAHLPKPPPEAEATLTRLEREETRLQTLLASYEGKLNDMTRRIAELSLEPAILAEGPAIAEANAWVAEHDSAVNDLPRRLTKAQELRHALEVTLAQIGGSDAESLILPTAKLAELREALSRRSGVETALATARAEVERAEARLAQARLRHADLSGEDDAALADLFNSLRSRDLHDALARARRTQTEASLHRDSCRAALLPWQGPDLAGIPVPSPQKIRTWSEGLEAIRLATLDQTRLGQTLAEQIGTLEASMILGAGEGDSLAQAASLRQRREALWARHLAELSAASAQAFETALREDDRASALLVETMAEARAAALHRAELDLRRAQAERAEAKRLSLATEATAIRAEVADACRQIGLPVMEPSELESWLAARDQALEAERTLAKADAELWGQLEQMGVAAQTLGAALGLALPADLGPEGRFDMAQSAARTRLAALEARRSARRELADLEAALQDRKSAAERAEAQMAAWLSAWQALVKDTRLEAENPSSQGLGTLIELLDRLGTEHREWSGMTYRIDRMEENRLRFTQARDQILSRLNLPLQTPWPDVQRRLRLAEDAARDHEALLAEAQSLKRQAGEDRLTLEALQAERRAFAARLGLQDPSDLPRHLGLCLKAEALRTDIARLQDQLALRPQENPSDEDAEEMEARLTTLTEAHAAAEETLGKSREQRALTAKALEALGGDDALARVMGERQTLLLDLAERSRAHLAARLGLATFEEGLKRFRDLHRSTMLERASRAFSRLSNEAYEGLASQSDGAQEVLVAKVRGGGTRLASQMSKGTRFQLYLALRIAGYHELAQSRPAVPFIADDIMESFDDTRSGATFALLGEMAKVGQVIYLTHHRHLCEIAKREVPNVMITDLTAG